MSRIKILNDKIHRLDLSEQQIACYLNTNKNNVVKWLSGHKKISYKYLWNLCDLLDLDIKEFLKNKNHY